MSEKVQLAKVMGVRDYFMLGFGSMVGVGWCVAINNWISAGGGVLITVISFMKKCDLMLEMMDKEFPENVKYTRPEGGMFIWVELPENVDADVLLDTALAHGVAYIPGEPFFANGGPKNTIRMNFTTVSEEQIKKGIKILGDVLKTVC